MKKPIALVIMDGVGIGPNYPGNAYEMANKPNLDILFNEYPHSLIEASGEAVGLPEGQMGNSEVGHLNIGAGRVVYQSLTRVNIALKDGTFATNSAFIQAFEYVKQHNSKLHIFGLLSDGGVHSHILHIEKLFALAKANGVKRTYMHAFLDGRDVPPKSGVDFIKALEADMETNQYGKIASVHGRYYVMDRDKNWNRVQKSYDVMSFGTGLKAPSAVAGVEASYQNGINDEFVLPFLVDEAGLIENNDAIIFANFRPDRAIEIGTAYSNPSASKVNCENGPKNILFVSMMKYADTVIGPLAFQLNDLNNTLGDYLSSLGLKQLRIAETEKYAHVTFFFDGGIDKEIIGATRILIPSPKVATYDLQPEMSAYAITDAVIEELETRKYDVVILNFANGDMVGHTGVIPATIKAVETVDECVGRVIDKVSELGGVTIVTADHGNCEKMLDEDGQPFTAHSNNPVPVIITQKGLVLRDTGSLGDLAPTILDLMNIKKPAEMTGTSLIISQ
ncbi:MAG: 2,3-bisphosphoglycerate-independent phosphoglycerate mutase [Candidatus Izemoplasmatales bacterium]|nr:2,3-bisphosphoglycerate-independent phosphoglycerate mutase [Candidatus Izemoplasmatales bacterium]